MRPTELMERNTQILEIFYAEDQPADRILFKMALEELRIPSHLTMVSNGEEAMQILSEDNGYLPDIILLDLKMPYKNGYECLDEIRKNKKFENTPVVIFSNSSEESDILKTYSNKANLYIQKPFNIEKQIKLMQRLFALDRKEYFPQPGMDKYVFKIKGDQ